MLVRPGFMVRIDHEGYSFTPLRMLEYIDEDGMQDSKPIGGVAVRWVNQKEIDGLRERSNREAKRIINSYKLTLHQMLTKDSSPAGAEFFKLARQHEETVNGMIQKGANKRGVLF